MKKQKKVLELGEEFLENSSMEQGYYTQFKRLEDCYTKCSDAKKSVYNYYFNLLKNNADYIESYGVRSYNCNFINLHSIVEKNNKKYYLLITPSHNYFREI